MPAGQRGVSRESDNATKCRRGAASGTSACAVRGVATAVIDAPRAGSGISVHPGSVAGCPGPAQSLSQASWAAAASCSAQQTPGEHAASTAKCPSVHRHSTAPAASAGNTGKTVTKTNSAAQVRRWRWSAFRNMHGLNHILPPGTSSPAKQPARKCLSRTAPQRLQFSRSGHKVLIVLTLWRISFVCLARSGVDNRSDPC